MSAGTHTTTSGKCETRQSLPVLDPLCHHHARREYGWTESHPSTVVRRSHYSRTNDSGCYHLEAIMVTALVMAFAAKLPQSAPNQRPIALYRALYKASGEGDYEKT